MPVTSARTRLRAGLVVATSALLLLAGAPSALADPTPPPAPSGVPAPGSPPARYVVALAAKPIASYTGGVRGFAATRPTDGRRVQVASTAAKRYRSYLQGRQRTVAARVGARPVRSYSVSLNGFVADLTPDQVVKLQGSAGVVSVTKDVLRKPLADTKDVDFLDLTGKKGVWNKLGGKAKAGRGVVVGVIDTGVWPEAKSFGGAALGSAGPTKSDPYRPYRVGAQTRMVKSDGSVFVGACQTGERFPASACNTKLISARYFGQAWLANNAIGQDEYRSPRDGDEHGTHTASTAAGNADVAATIQGRSFGSVSGVAPAAKVAVYKALWTGKDEAATGGYTSDLVAAIDQAVADGVDVINYSVGSSSESDLDDPLQLAFLQAASAGVFVSASAGNSGPGASTLDNTSPWVTTVAATSIKPRYGTVTLGDGRRFPGVTNTVTAKVGPAPLVAATDVKTARASAADATLCTPGTLDPAKVAGKIVACDRGVIDRVAKSAEVKRAGGIGMVLLNLAENSLDGDLHTVPTVILNPPASTTLKAYARTAGATVTLSNANTSGSAIRYPQIAGFSSRGPSLANHGDLLKPDLAAPGVNILAASAPNTANHQVSFNFLSGTSMAAPQVAGLAALYFGAHPRYSPTGVKSALMTTAAATVDTKGKKSTDAYAQGAGIVVPTRMFNPGVLVEANATDWLGYLEGQGVGTESGVKAIDPSNYNNPSIAVGDLVGRQTVTRRVTSVRSGSFKVKATVPGFTTSVSPSTLRFSRAHQTKKLKVTFTRTSAAFGQAAFGGVTLKSSKASARLPVALTAAPVAAPAEVSGTGTSGSTSVTVTSGTSGSFALAPHGLVAPRSSTGSVSAGGEAKTYPVTVPAGAPLARFAVDPAAGDESADVDLGVYRNVNGRLALVGSSAGGSAHESVTLTAPPAGSYLLAVLPYADPAGKTSTSFTARSWVVQGSVDDFAVTPTVVSAVSGRPFAYRASWHGLAAGQAYLGWVGYPGGSGTVVTVRS